MQIGVFCFMVGSAISTGANSMIVLLVGRGVAGIGAAALLTVRQFSMKTETSLNPIFYRSSESFWQILPTWKTTTYRRACYHFYMLSRFQQGPSSVVLLFKSHGDGYLGSTFPVVPFP